MIHHAEFLIGITLLYNYLESRIVRGEKGFCNEYTRKMCVPQFLIILFEKFHPNKHLESCIHGSASRNVGLYVKCLLLFSDYD
jgi:hypothetical protein